MEKTLVLGLMPAQARPQTHLAAGPWCFAGQESLFPHWENEFTFAQEPLTDPDKLAAASDAAKTLCVEQIPELANKLDNSQALSLIYWQTLLVPWACNVAKQIVERSLRIRAMIDAWGQTPLQVPVLPADLQFDFEDEQDFTFRGCLGQLYNHWLCSRILEASWPGNWQKITISSLISTPAPKQDKTVFSTRARNLARNLLLKLPFPVLKGLSLRQALAYSKALLHSCKTKDQSLDLAQTFCKPESLEGLQLPADVFSIFIKSLPRSLKNLKHPGPPKKSKHARLRVASIIAYENADYRQDLALWREKGNRLAYCQHGGNYGQVKTACETELVEYAQDAFFTWGWSEHGAMPGNFIPMPYPRLAQMADSWQGGSEELIFVGTEMAAFGYRLDSRPTPMQFVDYRQAKADFLAALPPEILARTLYRPYFPVPGTLEDAPWLLRRFPNLQICAGPLLPRLLKCRLLVLDHPGTTMLEALAANIPFLLYWPRKFWPLSSQADQLLDMLAGCGIWHSNPMDAARKLESIWNGAEAWWNSPQIQTTRKYNSEKQARLPDGPLDLIWTSTLEKL